MSADQEKRMAFQGSPAPPLEDNNILSMILRRLPPLPSSLPRASLVCKRWRRLVTHPHFHRSFLAHHKKAPLLGFFCKDYNGRIDFRPTLDPPNRMPMPAARFSSCLLSERHTILGCHHGRLLVFVECSVSVTRFSRKQQHYLVVWDPITGDRCYIDIPQMFTGKKIIGWKGVVVCASQEKDHIHGACHSENFQVVLIGSKIEGVSVCVYSSETCTWGDLISLSQPQPQPPNLTCRLNGVSRCSLVGNSVYWMHAPVGFRSAVLEFDLHRQTLAIIEAPPDASNFNASFHHDHQSFILPADGGGLSFIVLSGNSVHVWKRISNGHDVAGWLFENTVELSNLLSLKPRVDRINIQKRTLGIVGHDENNNVIFRLRDSRIIYLVNLKTLQFKELSEKIGGHPFSSFYTVGMHPETGMHGDENVCAG